MAEIFTHIQIGAVANIDEDEDLEFVKKTMHDRIFAELKERRLSGVSWQIYTASEGLKKLDELFTAEADGYRQFLCSNPNGALVLAMADCWKDG